MLNLKILINFCQTQHKDQKGRNNNISYNSNIKEVINMKKDYLGGLASICKIIGVVFIVIAVLSLIGLFGSIYMLLC